MLISLETINVFRNNEASNISTKQQVLGVRISGASISCNLLSWLVFKILKTIAKGIDKFSCYLSLYLQFLIDLILVLKNLQWYLVLTLSTLFAWNVTRPFSLDSHGFNGQYCFLKGESF